MKTKKLYKTVYTIEVLSEEPISLSLEDVLNECYGGDYSGLINKQSSNVTISGKDCVKEILNHGTSLEFFNIDVNGNEL